MHFPEKSQKQKVYSLLHEAVFVSVIWIEVTVGFHIEWFYELFLKE